MKQTTYVWPHEPVSDRLTCPIVECRHPAFCHRTRPGGKTSYCVACAIEADRGWRTKQHICYLDQEAVGLLNDIDKANRLLTKKQIDSKTRREAQMAPVNA